MSSHHHFQASVMPHQNGHTEELNSQGICHLDDHSSPPSMACCSLDAIVLGKKSRGQLRRGGSVCFLESVGCPACYPLLNLTVKEEEWEVLHSALLSLYSDEIPPALFNLRGRLLELTNSPTIVAHHLELYQSRRDLYRVTYNMDCGQAVVFLRNPPDGFNGWVDASDPAHPYTEEMWTQFGNFLLVITQSPHFPKGRYGLARYLQRLDLPFMRGFSLGRFCHVVQRAISRGLLVYEDNVLKPVAACVRDARLVLGVPIDPLGGRQFLQEIRQLRSCILELFQEFPKGFNLATLKQKVRLRFNYELSQTVFGFRKLVDLLNIRELASTCCLDTDGRCMKVVPRVVAGLPP
eukprot:GHVS01056915.1.p1 GENE.GHVS01056915.1~~GHVS01056915.1.p1  ORF type:complete len:367 (+),score=51.45 GHVS01056915.1:52-1101(+)